MGKTLTRETNPRKNHAPCWTLAILTFKDCATLMALARAHLAIAGRRSIQFNSYFTQVTFMNMVLNLFSLAAKSQSMPVTDCTIHFLHCAWQKAQALLLVRNYVCWIKFVGLDHKCPLFWSVGTLEFAISSGGSTFERNFSCFWYPGFQQKLAKTRCAV